MAPKRDDIGINVRLVPDNNREADPFELNKSIPLADAIALVSLLGIEYSFVYHYFVAIDTGYPVSLISTSVDDVLLQIPSFLCMILVLTVPMVPAICLASSEKGRENRIDSESYFASGVAGIVVGFIPVALLSAFSPMDVLTQPTLPLLALILFLLLLCATIKLVQRCRTIISSERAPGNTNPPDSGDGTSQSSEQVESGGDETRADGSSATEAHAQHNPQVLKLSFFNGLIGVLWMWLFARFLSKLDSQPKSANYLLAFASLFAIGVILWRVCYYKPKAKKSNDSEDDPSTSGDREATAGTEDPDSNGHNPPLSNLGKPGFLVLACASVAILAYFGHAISAATMPTLHVRRTNIDYATDTGTTEYRVLDVIGGRRIICTPVDNPVSCGDVSGSSADESDRYFVFETDGDDHFVIYEE